MQQAPKIGLTKRLFCNTSFQYTLIGGGDIKPNTTGELLFGSACNMKSSLCLFSSDVIKYAGSDSL